MVQGWGKKNEQNIHVLERGRIALSPWAHGIRSEKVFFVQNIHIYVPLRCDIPITLDFRQLYLYVKSELYKQKNIASLVMFSIQLKDRDLSKSYV